MDADKLRLYIQLVARLPLLARVAILHMLRLSTPSRYLDLRTELTVALIRSLLAPSRPLSITETQRLLNRDPGVKGRIWVANYTAPAPEETSIRDVVVRAIENLRQPDIEGGGAPRPLGHIEWPDIVPVEAEWVGYRADATPQSRLPPGLTEAERYAGMMAGVRAGAATILHLHGGAYFLMDPSTYRPSTKLLAKLTGGRCYSVRYRLAPQNPFPAALVDALLSYLTLLYPPPGAFHEAVRPEHIVFSGDSAGGNLCMALTQLLLELGRTGARVRWLGREVAVPLPAGVALSSPWLDLTHSSPSCRANAQFDYLPAPPPPPQQQQQGAGARRPPCPAWPASPPRRLLYCADALATHPLVTPVAARCWRGCPPVYLSCGWELLADEDRYLAGRLHSDGVPVVFEEFEAMPHCFQAVLPGSPASVRSFAAWAGFIRDVVVVEEEEEGVATAFRTVGARGLGEVDIDPAGLSPYTEEELRERLRAFARGVITASATGGVGTRL